MNNNRLNFVVAIGATGLLSFGLLAFGFGASALAFDNPTASPFRPLPETSKPEEKSDHASDAQSSAPELVVGHGHGWLRAYATGDLPEGARMLMADYYESEIEMAVRKELVSALDEKGLQISSDDDSAPFQITYSAKLIAGGKRAPARSSLRLEPDRGGVDDPSTFGRETPPTGFRPAIAIGGGDASKPKAPSITVSVFVVSEGVRVWSGFAETELDGRSRRELARVLTRALMAHWGESASFDDVSFVGAGPPSTLQ